MSAGLTLLLTYTPRAGVDLQEYHRWLAQVDNPFFNARPSVRRYVNYRIERSTQGEAGFTHFDLLDIASGADETSVFGDPEIAAFAREWVRLWGAVPDPDAVGQDANYHAHVCRAVAAPDRAAGRPRRRKR